MKTNNLMGSGLVLVMSTFVCGNALADNCNGNWTNIAMSGDTIDLGDGHTLTTFFSSGSVSSANSPLNVVGACGGYVLTTPDGRTRIGYACARKDKDGDSYSDAGGMEPGADHGTWTKTGGTGVFAGGN